MSEKPAPVDGPEMMAQLSAFIGQYLDCTEYQRALLALWIVHTHSYLAFPVTPYLHICSRERESGKSVCLGVLYALGFNPWITSSFTPAVMLRRLQKHQQLTFLFDDVDTTFRRSLHPFVFGLLRHGFIAGGGFAVPTSDSDGPEVSELCVFTPKAFAGMRTLPDSIAAFCIPVNLEPKLPQTPLKRFRLHAAREEAIPLRALIHQWGVQHNNELQSISDYREDQFPAILSPARQECVEPLLQIADCLGGSWPEYARKTLVKIYSPSQDEDVSYFPELVTDMYDVFASRGNPEYLPTGYALACLTEMPGHPWKQWRDGGLPMQHPDLAEILRPKGIRSYNQRHSVNSVIKCYRRKDFIKWWRELQLKVR